MQTIQGTLTRIIRAVLRIGFDPNDSEELRLQKAVGLRAIVLGGFPALIIWTTLFFIFGEADVGWIGVGWTGLTIILLILLTLFPRIFSFNRFIVLLSFLVASFIILLRLGGIANSGAYVVWGLIAPLFERQGGYGSVDC